METDRTGDMYSAVRPRQRKRDWRLWAAIGLFLIVLAGGVVPTVWRMRYQARYREFVDLLARDRVYARKFGTLTLETGGETYGLDLGEGYDTFISALVIAGPGRVGQPVPGRDPDAVIAYGNGSALSLWEQDLEGYLNAGDDGVKEGVYLLYAGMRGESYAYDTAGLDLDRILLWLKPEG